MTAENQLLTDLLPGELSHSCASMLVSYMLILGIIRFLTCNLFPIPPLRPLLMLGVVATV